MKALAVMNEKGGVGKTTLVAHAGWFFAERYRTLVIDLDQQANLTATLGAHVSSLDSVELFAQVAQVPSVGALTLARSTRDLLGVEGVDRGCIETFRDSLASMARDYDVCVIDTPPALTNRTFGALLAADAILAPSRPGGRGSRPRGHCSARRCGAGAARDASGGRRYDRQLRLLGSARCGSTDCGARGHEAARGTSAGGQGRAQRSAPASTGTLCRRGLGNP
jgi:hypothetical protein